MPLSVTAAAPSDRQRAAIKDLLWSQPALVAGGSLLILYVRTWARQAAWLCAYARAAGLEVSLAGLASQADAFARRLHGEAGDGLTIFVLADLDLDLPAGPGLPPGTVQLAGMPGAPPLDLWEEQAAIAEATRAQALAMPDRLSIATAAGSQLLDVRTDADGWQADTGARSNGTALVLPAGAVHAEVAQASGTLVADGAISVSRPVRWDARLAGRPVTMTVRDATVTSIACEDPQLRQFLHRAIFVHHAASLYSIRVGLSKLTPGFSADQGPVNACHPGVTARLRVNPPHAYSAASADLRIDLTARHSGEPW